MRPLGFRGSLRRCARTVGRSSSLRRTGFRRSSTCRTSAATSTSTRTRRTGRSRSTGWSRRAGAGITVLAGTECDILDGGSMDSPDEVLKELDFTIASVHSKFNLPRNEMTDRIVAAVRNPYVSVLAHPTTRKIGARNPIEADFDEGFAAW